MPGDLHRHLLQATTSAQARREPCLPSGHLNCALDTEEGAGAEVELLGLGAEVELLGLGAEMQQTLGLGKGGENICVPLKLNLLLLKGRKHLKVPVYRMQIMRLIFARVSKIKIKTKFIIRFV